MDGPPVCSHPSIFFFKDSLPTKSCSKPMMFTKHSLFNHDVSSFGTHAHIVGGEGPAAFN